MGAFDRLAAAEGISADSQSRSRARDKGIPLTSDRVRVNDSDREVRERASDRAAEVQERPLDPLKKTEKHVHIAPTADEEKGLTKEEEKKEEKEKKDETKEEKKEEAEDDEEEEPDFEKMGFCDSFAYYRTMMMKRQRTCGGCCKVARCQELDYRRTFGKWNVLWLQMVLLLIPPYFICLIWVSTQNADSTRVVGELLQGLVIKFGAMIAAVPTSHLAYHYLVIRDGCCAQRGLAMWTVVYFFYTVYFVFLHPIGLLRNPETADLWNALMTAVFSPLLFPFFFIQICLCKMGASSAWRHCCATTRQNMREAVADFRELHLKEGAEARERGENQAPTAFSTPGNVAPATARSKDALGSKDDVGKIEKGEKNERDV